MDIIIKKALLDEASIHTAEMTEIKTALREDKRWEIYTDLLSTIKKFTGTLNQMHNILTELYNQGKRSHYAKFHTYRK